MNQILVTENKSGKKNNSTVDIKKVVLFFSIAIIIFGAILIVEGVIGLNKDKDDDSDQDLVAIATETPTPSNPIDDDEEVPTLELKLSGSTIKIIAKDETELDYIEYAWNDEETTVVASDSDKNKIETSVELRQGTNTLKVKAVDKAGNESTKENDFKGEYEPEVKVYITEEGDGIIIMASCEDGINKIEFTQNGNWYRLDVQNSSYSEEDFISMGAIPEYSDDGKIIEIEYTYKGLVEGLNNFSVYVYSTEGRVGTYDGYLTYTPSEQ